MFTHYLFLILVLVLTAIGPEISSPFFTSPVEGFLAAILFYLFFLGFLTLQCKKSKEVNLKIIHSELFFYLVLYYFFFGGERIFETVPFLSAFRAIEVGFSLLLYLGGLVFCFYLQKSFHFAKRQFLFIVPFVLPFILFTFSLDILYLFHLQNFSETAQAFVIIFLVIFFLLGTIAFFPYLILKLWGCVPLKDPVLKDLLEAVCSKAQFKHGGIVIWKVMDHTMTAAIIGILPKYRYLLFTESILSKLSPVALEAVLAHEIGHSQRHHLLIIPVIFLGMTLFATFVTLLIGDPLFHKVRNLSSFPYKEFFLPAGYFFFYALLFILYFRFVFGYFSRLFERQADLHVLKCGIPIESMIKALNDVGIYTGNTHLLPSWHHYSIQERIDFLKKVSENLHLAHAHHRKVKLSLIFFALIFLSILGFLIL